MQNNQLLGCCIQNKINLLCVIIIFSTLIPEIVWMIIKLQMLLIIIVDLKTLM